MSLSGEEMKEINNIYNEDSIEAMKNMDSECVDLLVTDPPYKTITGGNNNGKNSKRPKGMLSSNKKIFSHQNIKIPDWMPEVYRVLKQGSHAYIFTNVLNLTEMLNEAQKAGFRLHNLLCWEKNNCTPSQYYMKNCEYVLFLRKGKAKWINDIGGSKTVHQFNNIIGKKIHPCEKPIDLLKFYIANSSDEGDIVLDSCMGSGTTGLACKNLNRKFIGIEKEEKYFEIAKERISIYG